MRSIAKQSCKECGKLIPRRNNQVSFACQMLHLCRYCYRAKFPEHSLKNAEPARQVYQKHLTPWERAQALRRQFEGVEVLIWSPDFYKEWIEYVQAVERGELIL